MKEFHRDFANRTGLAQAWTVKSADRLFTLWAEGAGAVALWYCRWPSGLTLTASRGSTPLWSRARVGRGTQTKAQYNAATGPYWPKGARNKKKVTLGRSI